ncbi:MAG: Gfo/Idh/MocA family oxidoreductase [Verrucomicrobiae bacterium]|nr:Gfo/Idh/MocA family oxidoreductase [Verrucomicrobiae bacterium]
MRVPSKMTMINRRQFLATTTLAAVAGPSILTGYAATPKPRPAPSGRISVAMIGCGGMGRGNMGGFLNHGNCQVVAVCDVDQKHLQDAINTVNAHYKNQDCKGYHDYRELLARPDIDAVMIATPDHWHALVAVEAASQGKDIYGEKPLARTIAEQQAIVKAVQENQRIWQTGSWQRSEQHFQYAAEIVRNGLIGKIKRVEVGLPSGYGNFADNKNKMGITPPPPELDYDFWSGPSLKLPYIEARVHNNWRWNYNTGGGQLLDWIGHHCDIAHWGMDCDRSGPSEIEGYGEFPPKDAVWNTCTKYRLTAKYPNDIEMIIAGGHPDIRSGTKWIGTDGWVWVDRGNSLEASNKQWEESRRLPDALRKVKLYESRDHIGNFLDCVKSRQPTITPVETAHHSATPGHLGLIAMLVGRKIRWDVRKEQIIGDAEASKLLTRPYRAPWNLG